MHPNSPVSGLDPEAVWRVLVDSLDVLPDATLVEHDEWVQLRTPSSRHPWHNTILRARLSRVHMRARIEKIRDEHLARQAGLRWVVGLGSAPPELSEALADVGVGPLAHTLGMARPVPSTAPPPDPTGVRVRLATVADVELLGEMGTRGWQRGVTFGKAVAERARRAFDTQPDELLSWIAFLNDEPVGSSSLRILGQIGYLQGAAVVPGARGRGVYAALTWVRLAEMRKRSMAHAVIWAHESTSAPTAYRMGFEKVSTAIFHEMEAPTA